MMQGVLAVIHIVSEGTQLSSAGPRWRLDRYNLCSHLGKDEGGQMAAFVSQIQNSVFAEHQSPT